MCLLIKLSFWLKSKALTISAKNTLSAQRGGDLEKKKNLEKEKENKRKQ